LGYSLYTKKPQVSSNLVYVSAFGRILSMDKHSL
jgi:hypothetical protein